MKVSHVELTRRRSVIRINYRRMCLKRFYSTGLAVGRASAKTLRSRYFHQEDCLPRIGG